MGIAPWATGVISARIGIAPQVAGVISSYPFLIVGNDSLKIIDFQNLTASASNVTD